MTFQPPSSFAIANPHPMRGFLLASLGCGIWVAFWGMRSASRGQVSPPFAEWDIALVSTIAWTPVGFVLADALSRLSRWLIDLLAMGLLFSSAILAGPSSSSLGMSPDLARWVWGGLVGISVTVLAQSFNRSLNLGRPPVWPFPLLVLLVPLSMIVTSAYTAERIRYHKRKISDSLSQYRLMDARERMARLQILDPSETINNMPLSLMTKDMDQELNSIREEVDSLRKLLADASITKPAEVQTLRIQLAQNLAILGRMEQAIAELTHLTETDPEASRALNLLATMWEHQEQWEVSLSYYEKARNLLLQQPASREQHSDLVKAWKGIAYTQRKRGRYREAEAAYEAVLKIAPTAEHHFLSAQFYKEAQQGGKAQFHAYQAADLNSLTYRERADQLVQGMIGEQFGCWSIFQNRRR